jgi:hypothetical protein
MAHTDTMVKNSATRAFYRRVLTILQREAIPFVVGGAYALRHYTGIVRQTKDLDVFLLERDSQRALTLLSEAGYYTEMTSPIWLAKVFGKSAFVDLLFCSANGLVAVDEEWFAYAEPARILDLNVQICALEELIWSKAYVMNRDRYDGADIAHLVRAQGHAIDWHRLLQRFGEHWAVLFSHLILFDFIYPAEQDRIPRWVRRECLRRTQHAVETPRDEKPICRGPLLSRDQYQIDLDEWNYQDARVIPFGKLTDEAACALREEQCNHHHDVGGE